MENTKYGVDYIYEKYGKIAIEKEILTDQMLYWKNCYEQTKKEADEEINRLKEALKEAETAKETWYSMWCDKCADIAELKKKIEGEQNPEQKEEQIGDES